MAISIVMPALELAQETGKLLLWRKKEGERVSKGEPLLEVETDKAVVEIESPADGILAGVKAREGAVIPVGQTVAWIVGPDELPPAESIPTQPSSRMATSGSVQGSASAPTITVEAAASSARISPKARRLARERGVDISGLRGSGPAGEIVAADILAAATQPATEVEALGAVGRLMAERTTQSWTTVPHFFVQREVDVAGLVAARAELAGAIERAQGVRPTYTDLLVALVGRALKRHPRIHASWIAEGIRLNPAINIAVAVAVKDGVVAPVVQKADAAELGEIAVRLREMGERAKAGRLHPSDLTGATFTISNLGMHDVDAFTAIITPPQAAILAVGRIAERVVPVQGQPSLRAIMILTLSCDHRVIDGVRAALFLKDVAEAIREPQKWLS